MAITAMAPDRRSSVPLHPGSRSSERARWTGSPSPLLLFLLGFLLLGTWLLGCGSPELPPEPPSILLITVDSLRVDRLALWNPAGGVPTPHLESLAARGSLYRNAWATAPWTAPSLVSVFSGLYPPSHGIFARDDTTPPGLPTLPRLLAEHGYRQGNFSFFSDISYFRNLGLESPRDGLSHERIPTSFRTWLRAGSAEEPFFAWLHLLEPHLPYGATGYRASEVLRPGSSGLEAAQRKAAVPVGSVDFAAGDRQVLLELYDRDLEAMDEALGEVLDALAEAGRTERTLVVLVADHGEELLEHGWIGHASTAIDAKLVAEVLRVPLVVAGPGVPVGSEFDGLVQPLDLFPTLVELLRPSLPDLELPRRQDGVPLPGLRHLGRRWPVAWGPFLPDRELAFFDSSMGGNLTPRDRREERVQGVTDGNCLLATRLVPGQPESRTLTAVVGEVSCDGDDEARLLAALEAWRRRQATQRLAVLSAGSEGWPPAPEEVGSYREALEVRSPAQDQELLWETHQGQVILDWETRGGAGGEQEGRERTFWVEYEAGSGLQEVAGRFAVERPGITFGPFPRGFWNDLAGYSPFRFRVLEPQARVRSPWREFQVKPVEAR